MWIIVCVIIFLTIVIVVLIKKETVFEKTRKEADHIIITKEGTPEHIKEVINNLLILGMYEKITNDNDNQQEDIEKEIKQGKDFNEAFWSTIDKKLQNIAKEDEERIKALRTILEEI